MELTLYRIDLRSEFRHAPCSATKFRHLTDEAQAAVRIAGRAMFVADGGHNAVHPPAAGRRGGRGTGSDGPAPDPCGMSAVHSRVGGSDTPIRMDSARTILYNRFGSTHTLPSIGAFLLLTFGEAERTTFGEFLARLHRYYRRTRRSCPAGFLDRLNCHFPSSPAPRGAGDGLEGGTIHHVYERICGLGVVGGDTLERDGVGAVLSGATRAPSSVGGFLDLAFGEAERTTFDVFLARLYRYYCDTGCSLVRTERSGECCEPLPIREAAPRS
jgi:hypothetical protein